MPESINSVWLVTREYAGIAEAGGVKNVACSLSERLAARGIAVTVFMPRYGCVSQRAKPCFSQMLSVAGENYTVQFSDFIQNGVRIVLVESAIFAEKQAVYVYTEAEAKTISGASRGKGYFDSDVMNVLLQRSVLAWSGKHALAPDVLHCQDAHTAMLPAMIRTDPIWNALFKDAVLVVTIHNAGPGYRQNIPGVTRAAHVTGLPEATLSQALFAGNVEPFLLAAPYSILTTVSPWYAEELTSHKYDSFSEGLSGEFERRGIRVIGITNGIDYARYDPTDTTISLLPYAYDPTVGDLAGKYRLRADFIHRLKSSEYPPDMELFGSLEPDRHAVYLSYHGRIAWQKGLDVFEKSARAVLDHVPQACFVILGQGDPVLESLLVRLAHKYVGRVVYLRGYERSWARMVVALSDFLVLPSAFEPCGLEDFIGQIFGTIPVAHAVGGLQKIINGETGFTYSAATGETDAASLAQTLIDLSERVAGADGPGCGAVPEYASIIHRAALSVKTASSWDAIISEWYLPLYSGNLPA